MAVTATMGNHHALLRSSSANGGTSLHRSPHPDHSHPPAIDLAFSSERTHQRSRRCRLFPTVHRALVSPRIRRGPRAADRARTLERRRRSSTPTTYSLPTSPAETRPRAYRERRIFLSFSPRHAAGRPRYYFFNISKAQQKFVHQRVILLSVNVEKRAASRRRRALRISGPSAHELARLVLRFGFMEDSRYSSPPTSNASSPTSVHQPYDHQLIFPRREDTQSPTKRPHSSLWARETLRLEDAQLVQRRASSSRCRRIRIIELRRSDRDLAILLPRSLASSRASVPRSGRS